MLSAVRLLFCELASCQPARSSRLWLEDLGKNSSSGGGVGLAHDVLDVLLDRLLRDSQSVRDFLVGPALGQVFDHGVLALRQLEPLFGRLHGRLLAPADFFHGHDDPRVL